MAFQRGDRVITTKDLSGVRKGTKGVIVWESWGRYEVDFGDPRTRDVREDEVAKVSK